MDFFEAVKRRRSVRRFKPDSFPDEVVRKALEAAILAPNSSNSQTWDFHWVKNGDKKKKVVEACLSQSAARTAAHLIVVTADRKKWRRSWPKLIAWVKSIPNLHKNITLYYEKLFPVMYTPGPLDLFTPFKTFGAFMIGLFRPIMRGPFSSREITEVAVKSAALASENFVLAISAQGGATCMMEGFDEWRMKRVLKLSCSSKVVMVIGVGYEAERGIWGPQYRLPLEEVVHVHE